MNKQQQFRPATSKHIGSTLTNGLTLLAIIDHKTKYIVSDERKHVFGIQEAFVPDDRPSPGDGYRLLKSDFWSDRHEDIAEGDERWSEKARIWEPVEAFGKNDGTYFYRRKAEVKAANKSIPITLDAMLHVRLTETGVKLSSVQMEPIAVSGRPGFYLFRYDIFLRTFSGRFHEPRVYFNEVELIVNQNCINN